MRLIPPDPPEYDLETDEDLLTVIACCDGHERDRAARIFYERYAKSLHLYCQRFTETLQGDDNVQYLVLRTFERAFQKAGTYDTSGIDDQAHGRHRTFKWLTTIATRLLQTWLRSSREETPIPLALVGKHSKDGPIHGERVDVSEDLLSEDGAPLDDPSDPAESREQRCLREALDTLSKRDCEVLLLGSMYDVPGKQLRIPDDVLQEICQRWQTNPANLRAIRKRALARVEAYVQQHCRP